MINHELKRRWESVPGVRYPALIVESTPTPPRPEPVIHTEIPPGYVSRAEAERILSVSARDIYNFSRAGDLHPIHVKLDGQFLRYANFFSRAECERLAKLLDEADRKYNNTETP